MCQLYVLSCSLKSRKELTSGSYGLIFYIALKCNELITYFKMDGICSTNGAIYWLSRAYNHKSLYELIHNKFHSPPPQDTPSKTSKYFRPSFVLHLRMNNISCLPKLVHLAHVSTFRARVATSHMQATDCLH